MATSKEKVNARTKLVKLLKTDSSWKHVFTGNVENSVDPDQLVSKKPADLDLHNFQRRLYGLT